MAWRAEQRLRLSSTEAPWAPAPARCAPLLAACALPRTNSAASTTLLKKQKVCPGCGGCVVARLRSTSWTDYQAKEFALVVRRAAVRSSRARMPNAREPCQDLTRPQRRSSRCARRRSLSLANRQPQRVRHCRCHACGGGEAALRMARLGGIARRCCACACGHEWGTDGCMPFTSWTNWRAFKPRFDTATDLSREARRGAVARRRGADHRPQMPRPALPPLVPTSSQRRRLSSQRRPLRALGVTRGSIR